MSAVLLAIAWRRFICRACGWIYDERLGDPDGGLAPGTRFEDIPDDWSCPLCGVTKADFEPCEAIEPVPVARASRIVHRQAGVVIVGAGHAGWQAAEALRRLDVALPITVVCASSGDLYDKPLISVAGARSLTPAAMVRETAVDAARRLGVRLLAHTHAVRIDAPSRRLRTTRGTLRYDRLVMAHGATPRAAGDLTPQVCWRINDLDSYGRLRTLLDTGSRRVVVIGAGLVGCELANDLALQGHGVTLLDRDALPLAAHLPARAGQRLLEAWAPLALDYVGGVEIAAVRRFDQTAVVTTRCGQTVTGDLVIAATGLEAALALPRGAGLQVDAAGIRVDPATLRSSDPRIHALGDCASIGGRAQRYIEPIARQAAAIASAIAGDGSVSFQPRDVPLRIKTGSLPITLHGPCDARGEWVVECDTPTRLRMTQHRQGHAAAILEASTT